MDHEKILLVEKMCHLKKEQARQEEKFGFYEDHISQLTEDIKAKSRLTGVILVAYALFYLLLLKRKQKRTIGLTHKKKIV